MSRLSYKEFTERFNLDLTLTEYVKAMYLEAPVFGIGVIDLDKANWIIASNYAYIEIPDRTTAGNEWFKEWNLPSPFTNMHFNTNNLAVVFEFPSGSITTKAQLQQLLKGKKILYKKKGYYSGIITGAYSTELNINIDKTKSVTVTLYSRQVLVKGSAVDSGKIGVYNGTYGDGLKVGETHTLTSGGSSKLLVYANGFDSSGSTGYIVKVRIKVEQ